MHHFMSCLALIALACGGGCAATQPAKQAPPTASSSATPVTGPLLWEVEKDGTRNYVFAVAPNGVATDEIPRSVWDTLDKSRALAVIADLDALRPKVLAAWFDQTGKNRLSVRLTEHDWKRVTHELSGISTPKLVDGFVPYMVTVLLTHRGVPETKLTSALVRRARKQNKAIAVLDPDFEASSNLVRAAGIKHLRMVLLNLAQQRDTLAEIINMYRAGDVHGLTVQANELAPEDYDDPDAAATYFRQASTIWLDKMRPALLAGGLFMALDTPAVLHDTGLLAGLRARGYTIRRLGIGTPATIAAKAAWRMSPAQCRAFLPRIVNAFLEDNSNKRNIGAAERAASMERARPAFINSCLLWNRQQHACYASAADFKALLACDRIAAKAPNKPEESSQKPSEPKQQPSAPTSGSTDAARRASTLAADACACTDNECAKTVFARFVDWVDKVRHRAVSTADAQTVGKAAESITKCLMKQGIKAKDILKAVRPPAQ